ncbi:MAG: hypothetical protein KC620_19825 [Myxococcales bacterium]|nr:hypothetical protein [Myxococcales bacterium]
MTIEETTQRLAAVRDQVKAVRGALAAPAAETARVVAGFVAIEPMVPLSARTHEALTRFNTLLGNTLPFAEFVQAFPFLNVFLPPIVEALRAQESGVRALQDVTDRLQGAVAEVNGRVGVIGERLDAIGGATDRLAVALTGWDDRLDGFLRSLALAEDRMQGASGAFDETLASLLGELDAAAQGIAERLGALHTMLGAIESSGAAVSAFFEAYRRALGSVASAEAQVNSALSTINRAEPAVRGLDAVLQPLRWLISVDCGRVQAALAITGDGPRAAVVSGLAAFLERLEALIDEAGADATFTELLNRVVPLPDLRDGIEGVIDVVDAQGPGWVEVADALMTTVDEIEALSAAITASDDAFGRVTGDAFQNEARQLAERVAQSNA